MEQSSGGADRKRGTTRQQTHEIVIDAPVEAVWKAISEGEELTRWFVEEADVTPGVGGTISISWGGEEKGEGRIDEWEPNRKLRKTLMPLPRTLYGIGMHVPPATGHWNTFVVPIDGVTDVGV